MGSLMAGWDSPVPDPRSAKFLRNRSFTKEEIEAYWRSKKTTDQQVEKESGEQIPKSNSFPSANIRKSNLTNLDSETDAEKMIKNSAWWTMSNWAFLNEPPVIGTEAPYKYASQHHITKFSSSAPETHRPGITT